MPFRHSINPIAFEVFDAPISWYWLFYPAGFFLVFTLAYRSRSDYPSQHFIDHGIVTWCGVILGGRLGYVLFYNLDFFLGRPDLIYQFWTGGMSFHGALFGAGIGNWLYARYASRRFWGFSDLVCLHLPLALMLGRIGNFINGELWGRPSNLPWAVIFPKAGDIPRHPSQIYEALGEGIFLYALLLKSREDLDKPGHITCYFLIGYAGIRFMVEFFRQPDQQIGFILFLSMGQWLSLGLLIFATVLFCHKNSQLR